MQTMNTLPKFAIAQWDGNNLVNPGDGPLWSGKAEPPKVGDYVDIAINKLGVATVTGYFVQDNWLGLLVTLHSPPEWFLKQNDGDLTGHVFGAEIIQ